MMRNIVVKVVDKAGTPQPDQRVAIEVHKFMASGLTSSKPTNAEGIVNIQVDSIRDAQLTVYVKGRAKISKSIPQDSYTVVI